jgi:asparagine synthase (glutamine-hydrolysing)
MCGICGVIGIESRETGEALVRRMMAAIVHRGPDGEGLLVAPPVIAGSRRLSIIDLPGGNQPVWNETATLAVVYNGEIYNFRELRKQLESAGHKFRTLSDTEVIVHAFESWGEKCVEHMQGMFTFAIVEMPQGPAAPPSRVFIARDRLGIKPLYYTLIKGALYFASEVRALLASGAVPAELSPDALSSYLLFGSVSEPVTLVEGVSSLPPGHYIDVRLDSEPLRAPTPKSYWSSAEARAQSASAKTSDSSAPASRVRSLLEHAVASHLIADVPVGVFLSSGLDSTAIAVLASRAQKGIHTFTVAFPDVEFSEAEKARRTAERLGTTHSEFTLSGDDMLARLDEAVASFDQPSMDGINTYFVSWAARQAGLKVALSGLGSDEIFGGYSTFRSTAQVKQIAAAARWMPRSLRELITPPSSAARMTASSPDAFRKISAAWLDPVALPHPYFFTRALFTPEVVTRWRSDDATAWKSAPWGQWLEAAAREAHSMDDFTAVSWLELRSYLVNTLLRDTDAMSMRHSLEVRVPFLDTALVEYVLSLPESQKRNRARPKALLIAALGDLLPQNLIAQPKRTFTFPWENWLRGPLRERISAGLADWSPALEPSLAASHARKVWNDFLAGRTTWSRPWSLYVLNEWVKRNLTVPPAGKSERGKNAATVSVA